VVSSIIELHTANVIGSGFVKTNNKGERFIEIITEINMSNGHKVRCHPDFPNSGEWYDWFLVKWRLPRSSDEIRGCESSPLLWSHHKDESDKYTKRGIDLFNFEDQTYRTDRWGRTVDFRELLTNLEHHLPQEEMADDDFDKPSSDIDIYVPAKVVAIIKCKTTGDDFALVHSCEYRCHRNSIFTREWRLHNKVITNPARKLIFKPIYSLVPITSLVCPCMVVEEYPGLQETTDGHRWITEVFDRKYGWSSMFLEICRVGVGTLFTGNDMEQGPAATGVNVVQRSRKRKKR
jgi:hypothetical protein